MSQATVADYMSDRLVTINVKSSAEDIARLMDKRNISSVLITDDNNEIIGIFTERDIVKIIARDLRPDKIIAISPPVIYVDRDLSVEQASETMIRNKVRHLLVRDPDTKEIVGILTNTDMVRYLKNLAASKPYGPVWEAASIEPSIY